MAFISLDNPDEFEEDEFEEEELEELEDEEEEEDLQLELLRTFLPYLTRYLYPYSLLYL